MYIYVCVQELHKYNIYYVYLYMCTYTLMYIGLYIPYIQNNYIYIHLKKAIINIYNIIYFIYIQIYTYINTPNSKPHVPISSIHTYRHRSSLPSPHPPHLPRAVARSPYAHNWMHRSGRCSRPTDPSPLGWPLSPGGNEGPSHGGDGRGQGEEEEEHGEKRQR